MFDYRIDIIENLEKAISSERLSTYLAATSNNKENAIKLYLWNTELSAAFYLPLQGLEVTLRNALHRELACKYETDKWYELVKLGSVQTAQIDKANKTVEKLHGKVSPPHMVAELSFGFWISLLNRKYHPTLWAKTLYKAFPNTKPNRAKIVERLDHLRIFRNRIAHHESIFKRDLLKDYSSIIEAISWICPDTAKWIDSHNSVVSTLHKKPHI